MKLIPKYTLWEAIQTCLALGMKALEEVRELARQMQAQDFGLDDFDFEFDGERTITVILTKRGRQARKSFRFPTLLDRGVFKEGEPYERGDCVTFGGSLWIAQRETKGKPGEQDSEGWRLAVKRGRDGRDGKIPEAPQPVRLR